VERLKIFRANAPNAFLPLTPVFKLEMIEFILFSPQAGWASTFCIAKKVDKNARTGKLLRQTVPVQAAATKLVVFVA
jgi:hypothetical protein